MSRFFTRHSAAAKTGARTTAGASTMLGDSMAFWHPLHKGNTLSSTAASMADDLIQSPSPFHDYRCIIEVHKKASHNWAHKNLTAATNITERELALCHFVVNLFCKWNAPRDNNGAIIQYTLATFRKDVRSLWRNTPVPTQNAFATAFIGKLNAIIATNVIKTTDFPLVRDLGLTGVDPVTGTVVDQVLAGLNGKANITLTAAVPTDLASLSAQVQDEDDMPGLFVYHETQKNAQDSLGFFTSAVCLLVACVVKDQSPTDNWVNSRNARIASALGIPSDIIDYSPECTEMIKTMVKFRGLTAAEYSTLLTDLHTYCTAMDVPPLLWSLEQAAYTGLTIVTTMIENLASYPDMPWGLLFGEVDAELTSFLTACMYAYLFPYHGLKNVTYPATKFPNIATAAIQIAIDQGRRTYSQYKGKYTGAQMAKYQGIVNTFTTLSSATLSHDTLAHALPSVFGPVQSYKIMRGNVVCQIGGVAPGTPPPQTLLNAQSGQWDDQASTLTVGLTEVFRLIKAQHIAHGSDSIKALYDCVIHLHGAFQESPILTGHVTRPIPTAGPLVSLAALTNAANMNWQ